jgi:hypothetical protein
MNYRSLAYVLLLAGAAFAIIGIGIYLTGDLLAGAVLAIIGMFAFMIGLSMIRLYSHMDRRKD